MRLTSDIPCSRLLKMTPAVAQGHDKDPALEQFTGALVGDQGSGAKIHLRGLAWGEVQDDRRLGRALVDALQKPTHGRVAASKAVVAHQGVVNRGALDAGLTPSQDLLAEWLDRRGRSAALGGLGQHLGQGGIIRQRVIGIEPSVLSRRGPQRRRLHPPHQAAARNLAVGIAQAHPHQDLSILIHLKPPIGHRYPRRQKTDDGSKLKRKFETSALSGGPINPIRYWRH